MRDSWHASWPVSWPVIVVVSLATAVLSLWFARTVLLRLPVDYLVRDGGPTQGSRGRAILRNVGALLVILVGLVLAIPGVPGQGLLLVAVGIALLDWKGKRATERRFLGAPRVLASLNEVRRRGGAPPLLPPPTSS